MGRISESTPFQISDLISRFKENSKRFVVDVSTKNPALNVSGALLFIGLGCSLKWWYNDQLLTALLKSNLPALGEPQQKISGETGEYVIAQQVDQLFDKKHFFLSYDKNLLGVRDSLVKRIDLYANSMVVKLQAPWQKHAYQRFIGVFPDRSNSPLDHVDTNVSLPFHLSNHNSASYAYPRTDIVDNVDSKGNSTSPPKYTPLSPSVPVNWFKLSARGLCVDQQHTSHRLGVPSTMSTNSSFHNEVLDRLGDTCPTNLVEAKRFFFNPMVHAKATNVPSLHPLPSSLATLFSSEILKSMSTVPTKLKPQVMAGELPSDTYEINDKKNSEKLLGFQDASFFSRKVLPGRRTPGVDNDIVESVMKEKGALAFAGKSPLAVQQVLTTLGQGGETVHRLGKSQVEMMKLPTSSTPLPSYGQPALSTVRRESQSSERGLDKSMENYTLMSSTSMHHQDARIAGCLHFAGEEVSEQRKKENASPMLSHASTSSKLSYGLTCRNHRKTLLPAESRSERKDRASLGTITSLVSTDSRDSRDLTESTESLRRSRCETSKSVGKLASYVEQVDGKDNDIVEGTRIGKLSYPVELTPTLSGWQPPSDMVVLNSYLDEIPYKLESHFLPLEFLKNISELTLAQLTKFQREEKPWENTALASTSKTPVSISLPSPGIPTIRESGGFLVDLGKQKKPSESQSLGQPTSLSQTQGSMAVDLSNPDQMEHYSQASVPSTPLKGAEVAEPSLRQDRSEEEKARLFPTLHPTHRLCRSDATEFNRSKDKHFFLKQLQFIELNELLKNELQALVDSLSINYVDGIGWFSDFDGSTSRLGTMVNSVSYGYPRTVRQVDGQGMEAQEGKVDRSQLAKDERSHVLGLRQVDSEANSNKEVEEKGNFSLKWSRKKDEKTTSKKIDFEDTSQAVKSPSKLSLEGKVVSKLKSPSSENAKKSKRLLENADQKALNFDEKETQQDPLELANNLEITFNTLSPLNTPPLLRATVDMDNAFASAKLFYEKSNRQDFSSLSQKLSDVPLNSEIDQLSMATESIKSWIHKVTEEMNFPSKSPAYRLCRSLGEKKKSTASASSYLSSIGKTSSLSSVGNRKGTSFSSQNPVNNGIHNFVVHPDISLRLLSPGTKTNLIPALAPVSINTKQIAASKKSTSNEILAKQKRVTFAQIDQINLVDKKLGFGSRKPRRMSGYVYPDIKSNSLESTFYRWLSSTLPQGEIQKNYAQDVHNFVVEDNEIVQLSSAPTNLSMSSYLSTCLSTTKLWTPWKAGFTHLLSPKMGWSRTLDQACLVSFEIPLVSTAPRHLKRFFTTPSSLGSNKNFIHTLQAGNSLSARLASECKRITPSSLRADDVLDTPLSMAPITSNDGASETKGMSPGMWHSSISLVTGYPTYRRSGLVSLGDSLGKLSLPAESPRETKPYDSLEAALFQRKHNLVVDRKDNEIVDDTAKYTGKYRLAYFPGFTEPNQLIREITANITNVNPTTSFSPEQRSTTKKATSDVSNVSFATQLNTDYSRRKTAYQGVVLPRDESTKDLQFQNQLTGSAQGADSAISTAWVTFFLGPNNPLTDRQSHYFGQKRLSTLDTSGYQRDYLRHLAKEILAQSIPKGFSEKPISVERVKISSLSSQSAISSLPVKKRKYVYLLGKADPWHLVFQEQLRHALEDPKKYPPLTAEEVKDYGPGRIKVSAPLILGRFPRGQSLERCLTPFDQWNSTLTAFSTLPPALRGRADKNNTFASDVSSEICSDQFLEKPSSRKSLPQVHERDRPVTPSMLAPVPFTYFDNDHISEGENARKTFPKIVCHYPLATEILVAEQSVPGLLRKSTTLPYGLVFPHESLVDGLIPRVPVQEPLATSSWANVSVVTQWFFLLALLLWVEQMLLEAVLPALSALEKLLLGATGVKSLDRAHVVRISKSDSNTPKFQDIAGVDGLLGEFAELVLFLRGHKQRLWNRQTSQGVLLTGPPGTGKTFLVRALAGEAKVPVLILSAGALASNKSRTSKPSWSIRHAFRRARQLAPCILFIDEIDALGKSRGGVVTDINNIVAHMGDQHYPQQSSNSIDVVDSTYTPASSPSMKSPELAHTKDDTSPSLPADRTPMRSKFGPLTQLLVSMDGVNNLSGVLVIGATNRPESLDPALTRPGRFERVIRMEKPAEQKRVEILKLYSRNLGVHQQIPWSYLANRTVGLTTADLAVAMNYSSLKAIILGSMHTIETIEYGLDCIVRGASVSLSSSSPLSRSSFLSTTSRIPDASAGNLLSDDSKKRVDTNHKKNVSLLELNSRAHGKKIQRLTQMASYQAGKVVIQTLLPLHPPVALIKINSFGITTATSADTHIPLAETLSTTSVIPQFYWRSLLEARLVGLYGGKAASLLADASYYHVPGKVGDNVTTTAENNSSTFQSDLGGQEVQAATRLANAMVSEWAFYSLKKQKARFDLASKKKKNQDLGQIDRLVLGLASPGVKKQGGVEKLAITAREATGPVIASLLLQLSNSGFQKGKLTSFSGITQGKAVDTGNVSHLLHTQKNRMYPGWFRFYLPDIEATEFLKNATDNYLSEITGLQDFLDSFLPRGENLSTTSTTQFPTDILRRTLWNSLGISPATHSMVSYLSQSEQIPELVSSTERGPSSSEKMTRKSMEKGRKEVDKKVASLAAEKRVFATDYNDLFAMERESLYHALVTNSFARAFLLADQNRQLVDFFTDYLLRFQILRQHQILHLFSTLLLGREKSLPSMFSLGNSDKKEES